MHEEISSKTFSAVKLEVLLFREWKMAGSGGRHASQHKGSLTLALN